MKIEGETLERNSSNIINATPHDLDIYRRIEDREGSGGKRKVVMMDDGAYELLETHPSVGVIRLKKARSEKDFPGIGPNAIPVDQAMPWTGYEVLPPKGHPSTEVLGLLDRPGNLVVSMPVAQYLKWNPTEPTLVRPLYCPCTDFKNGVRLNGQIKGTTRFEVYP